MADEVGVAVSALTVNVNRQADGYAYIPLHQTEWPGFQTRRAVQIRLSFSQDRATARSRLSMPSGAPVMIYRGGP